jgi:A118 family predicted phage portal protein
MVKDAITLVVDFLNKEYKTDIKTEYYSYVRKWRDWWRGYYKPFHSYQELGVDNAPKQRELFRMNMAKRICEDWAAILLNEKTLLKIDDKQSSEFIQGAEAAQGVGGVLGANNFWAEGNELIEKAFGYGTGAFVLRAENAKVNNRGDIVPDAECRVGIEYIDAMSIIPLTVEKSKVTEAAFVSELVKMGKDYIYLETQTKDENGNYVITNRYFRVDDGSLKPENLPEGVAESVNTGAGIPWFVLIYPNTTNNIECQNGLGMSVFANAIDNLKGVDLAFNNFLRDFKLGGKKVFVNKKMAFTAADGTVVTPDDVAQSLFSMIGDDVDFDAKQLIQEYNPQLRVTENKEGVQSQLDYLSFKCGLGTHRYQFEGGVVKTATEYNGERQELVQHASRNMIVIETALIDLCRAILHIGKTFCKANVNPDAVITVQFEDGFVISEEDKAAKDLLLVQNGIMPAWEYRVRHMGEAEEVAKAAIEGMQTAKENPFGFMG